MSDDRFVSIAVCPACNCPKRELLGDLPGRSYELGRAIVPFPEGGIPLYRCEQCGLIYKGLLPSKQFLAEVVASEARFYWLNDETFDGIAPELASLVGENYDLIDVGAWSGGLLAACAGAGGRRSALDIVEHPDIAGALRGEFVHGFIEDQNLAWSENPYDVVTLFDVLEHLYEPNRAFANIRRFLRPGGVALVETGNSVIGDRLKDGPTSWWYIRLFEHHMVWNAQSIRAAAERHGLVLERLDRVRHKAHGDALTARAWRLFRAGLCWNGQRVWRSKIGLYRLQRETRGVEEADHLRVVLRQPDCGRDRGMS